MPKTIAQLLLKAKASFNGSHSAWIQVGSSLKVYASDQPYRLEKGRSLETVLTLANMVIVDPLKRGKGVFRRFLARTEKQVDLPIVIENVLNPRLECFLTSYGYCLIDSVETSSLLYSYYKRKDGA